MTSAGDLNGTEGTSEINSNYGLEDIGNQLNLLPEGLNEQKTIVLSKDRKGL